MHTQEVACGMFFQLPNSNWLMKKKINRPVKNDMRTYDNIRKVAVSQGDDYKTGCLLDYAYFKIMGII